MENAIVALAILFFLGHALKWFFIKTKIPDLLVLVIIGYIAGPTLGYVSPEDFGKIGGLLSTLALVVILYEGGLKLNAKDLMTSSLPALSISVLGFVLIASVAFFLAFVFAQQPWHLSLLLGLGLGSTSSAVVIPMVQFLSCSDKTKTILSLESAFTDVLAIVTFLVITDGIVSGAFSIEKLLIGIGPKTLMSIVIGVIFGLIWAFLKKNFSNFTDMTFSGEAFALLSYGLTEIAKHNGAMAVLALGFTLANMNLLPKAITGNLDRNAVSFKDLKLLQEITFLLKTIFFIYLGILIKLNDWVIVLFALLLAVCIFATRYICVKVLFRKENTNQMDAIVITGMGPRGLACAVLATIPLNRGVEGAEWLQDTMFAVIPFSIIFTALFVVFSEKDSFRQILAKFYQSYPESLETAAVVSSEENKTPKS